MKFVFDKKRIIVCFLAVFGMGFFLSFLMLCGLGTDPCSFMNKAISLRIGMLFGTWQLIINAVLLIIVRQGRVIAVLKGAVAVSVAAEDIYRICLCDRRGDVQAGV